MPIVTITTNKRLTGELGDRPIVWPYKLGEAIPQMFFEHMDLLHLNPHMPKENTRVSFKESDPKDINSPDVWILIQFAEVLTKHEMLVAKEVIESLIQGWFDRINAVPLNMVVDIFWGPGHGFLRSGATKFCW